MLKFLTNSKLLPKTEKTNQICLMKLPKRRRTRVSYGQFIFSRQSSVFSSYVTEAADKVDQRKRCGAYMILFECFDSIQFPYSDGFDGFLRFLLQVVKEWRFSTSSPNLRSRFCSILCQTCELCRFLSCNAVKAHPTRCRTSFAARPPASPVLNRLEIKQESDFWFKPHVTSLLLCSRFERESSTALAVAMAKVRTVTISDLSSQLGSDPFFDDWAFSTRLTTVMSWPRLYRQEHMEIHASVQQACHPMSSQCLQFGGWQKRIKLSITSQRWK